MRLAELIQEDLVKVGLEGINKWETIEERVDVLISSHELRLADRSEVLEAVFARERSLSTGMEHGLAVPHGAVDCVDDIIAALGLSKHGILFESLDGKPARLVVLLIIPKGSFQRHVRTLASIARLANNQEFRERICEAPTAADVMDVIYELEQAQELVEP